jgi:hypothetical protein
MRLASWRRWAGPLTCMKAAMSDSVVAHRAGLAAASRARASAAAGGSANAGEAQGQAGVAGEKASFAAARSGNMG